MAQEAQYTEDNIRSLEWDEHIRLRPGMYIGKLGDGKSPDDGIYILLKEVLDNSIDEFVMGAGKTIEVKIQDGQVIVRDYGRGIPLGKVVDVVSKINTGAKYDSKAFKKSVGLNGVGAKAVNAWHSALARSTRVVPLAVFLLYPRLLSLNLPPPLPFAPRDALRWSRAAALREGRRRRPPRSPIESLRDVSF